MTTFDVGIIGGGVHGASAAFHLADRDVTTVLFERGGAASGPTGRSSAVCRAYYTDPFLARVAREALDLFAAFDEHTGGRQAGFVETGALFLHGPDDADEVRDTVDRLTAVGTSTDLLEPDDLLERFPTFDLTGVALGAWERGAGYADPALTTASLLDRAAELGVDVRLHTPVRRMARPTRGAGVEVHLDTHETVTVGRLLLAAGPWTRPLAAQLGIDLPLTVERHIVATLDWGDAAPVEFVFADVVQGYYFRPDGHDRCLLGPLTPAPEVGDPDRFDEEISDTELADLATRVVTRVPGLGASRPRGGWASLYDVSPDWQPVIGEVADDVVIDAGTSGHGFKLAPGLGRHVADLLVGVPDPDLARFHPDRFEAGRDLHGGYGDARILG